MMAARRVEHYKIAATGTTPTSAKYAGLCRGETCGRGSVLPAFTPLSSPSERPHRARVQVGVRHDARQFASSPTRPPGARERRQSRWRSITPLRAVRSRLAYAADAMGSR